VCVREKECVLLCVHPERVCVCEREGVCVLRVCVCV